ncbi:MAG: ATP-binding protein [Gammaproteobacteria bacterium]|nr:ATP-binding protein [Gammaproteobacteria bacterium]
MQRQFSPHHIVLTLSAALLLVTLYAVWLATTHPWMGLEFVPDEAGVKISYVAEDSPAHRAGLQPGDAVKRLSLSDGRTIDLQAADLMIEPDDHALYSNYLAFFDRQSEIYTFLLQENITLTTPVGDYLLSPLDSRPISQLSFFFWFQLFCAYSIVVMGVLVWAYSQEEIASRLYVLAAMGMLVTILPSAIYTTRELALDGHLFNLLSRTNQLGVMLFSVPGTALFWFYPKPIHSYRVLPVLVFIAVLFLSLNYLQVYDSLDYAVRLPVVFWLLLDISFGVVQWIKSKEDPVSRAQLKWFILAWISGPIAFVGLNVVPILLDHEPVLTQKTGWVLFLFVYLGMALGLRRYRLFNLDRWILNAWFWLLCGAGVVIFDIFLFSNLGVNHEESIIISLALIGWVYFPLRQFIFDRLAKKSMRYNSRQLLPELLTLLLTRSHSESPRHLWPTLLDQMYNPLHIDVVRDKKTAKTLIENHGQSILVPDLPGCLPIRLYNANRGARLFSPNDALMIDAILLVYKHIIEFQDAQLQGAIKERKRLARDLHDDVSSKVLSLIYRSESEDNADLGRDILDELRNVINDLENGELSLESNLSDWQCETRQRCEDAGLQLDWQQSNIHKDLQLISSEKSNLRKILRESVTNIIKHSTASNVTIELSYINSHLRLIIKDDGEGFDMVNVKKGRGLLNMQRRAKEMGAEIKMGSDSEAGTMIDMNMPLVEQVTGL